MSLVELKPAHEVFSDDRYEIVNERDRAETLVRAYRGDAVAMHRLREMLARVDQNVFRHDDQTVLAAVASKIVKGELRVRKDPCARNDEKNRLYLDWIWRYRADSVDVAASLRTTIQNILGLAAFESDFGRSRDALMGNNFFSLSTTRDEPLPGQLDLMLAQADPNVGMAKFQDYQTCAWAFAKTKGQVVVGETEASKFAAALQKQGRSGTAKRGPRSTYAEELIGVIREVAIRLNC